MRIFCSGVKLFLLCLMLPFTFILVACDSGYEVEDKLKEVEKIMITSPDSASLILDELQKNETLHKSENLKSLASVLAARIKVSQGKTFIEDKDFDNAITYFEKEGDSSRLFETYQLASIKMRWLGKQDSAAFFFSKAIALLPDSQSHVKSDLYIKMSNLYARPSLKKNYAKAIKYARYALKEATSIEDSARALHDLGLFQSYLNQNDSAKGNIEKALRMVEFSNPDFETYALNFAVLPNVEKEKKIYYLNQIEGKHLGKLITMGFIYINNAKVDSAKYFLNEARSVYHELPTSYSINTLNSLNLLEQYIGFYEKGKIFQDIATIANDSINEIMNIRNRISEEQNEKNIILQMSLLESQVRHQYLLNIILGSLLLFIFITIFIVWHEKHKYNNLRKQLDQIKVEQIVNDVNEVSDDINKNNLIRQRLNISIDQFRLLKIQSDIDKMEHIFRSTGAYPKLKDRDAINKKLIACFADFIVDLRMTNVRLSMDDIVTCLLTCMNESNAAIASCLGTTESAVRTRKTRLRTKLPSYYLDLLKLDI